MTKFFDFVDTSKIQLNELLSITGYTNEFVLRKLYENNEKFVKLLGNGKISKVGFLDCWIKIGIFLLGRKISFETKFTKGLKFDTFNKIFKIIFVTCRSTFQGYFNI